MKTATGKVIKAFRKHLNYKQEFVADKLNITIGTLANIENGRAGLDIEKLYQISKLFHIAPGIIFDLIIEIYDTHEDHWLINALKLIKTPPSNDDLIS